MRPDPLDDERRLEGFFAAGRDAAPDMETRLISAILADAEEVRAQRRITPRAATGRTRGWRDRLREVLETIGGVQGAAAMTACVAAGFLLGLSGVADTGTEAIWPQSVDLAAPEDPVTGFFDLALEG